MTTQVTFKHRATEPLPAVDRDVPAGTHRASRTTTYVLIAILLVALVGLIAVLLGRS